MKKVCLTICFLLFPISLQAEDLPSYYLPFAMDKKVLISQSFGGPHTLFGAITHKDPLNYYAVDFNLAEGEWVCASRAGRVIEGYDGQHWFSTNSRDASFVRLEDRFGNIQDYQHLKPGSIEVRMGEQVQQGQCFAQVGNTGQTSGPHLHFAILRKNARGRLVSIPFQLIGMDEIPFTPRQAQFVSSYKSL